MRGLAAPPGLVALLRSLSPRSSGERATASGAVSAGSNPAGGTGQRHKFEHPDNLDASQPWVCDLRLRNGAVMFAPRALPQWPPLPLRRRSWHIAISAYEAVALLSQVGTPSPTQREHNGLASTAYMLPGDSVRPRVMPFAWQGPRRSAGSGVLADHVIEAIGRRSTRPASCDRGSRPRGQLTAAG